MARKTCSQNRPVTFYIVDYMRAHGHDKPHTCGLLKNHKGRCKCSNCGFVWRKPRGKKVK